MITRIFGGLGLFAVLGLFLLSPFSTAYAVGDYPSFGPQDQFEGREDAYLHFGDATYPLSSRQGISVQLDESSVSYQSIKATVTVDWQVIDERQISKFYVLANGLIVDWFEPYWDPDTQEYSGYYYIDINVSDKYIGSRNYFRVVGIHEGALFGQAADNYVVAWSQDTQTVAFKPLPVTDSTTHGWLSAIYDVLEELKDMMAAKMDALKKAVEDIYTPSPEAEARLNDAVDEFMDAMPMSEMDETIQEINESLEQAKNSLTDPNQERIELGGKFRFIEELPESEVTILDLTEYKTFVRTFRMLLEAMLWLFFFQMILNRFTPKMDI